MLRRWLPTRSQSRPDGFRGNHRSRAGLLPAGSVPGSMRAGLLVLGVLSGVDLLVPLVTDGQHPPVPVAVAVAVLGAAGLALAGWAWRGARRAVPWLLVLRAVAAFAAVPAIVTSGLPEPVRLLAAAEVLATVAGAALVLVARRTAGAR